MSLRKSPTMTPARLAANRRAALLSTGPRTKRGKARSRWNALRNGTCSETYFQVLEALFGGKPGAREPVTVPVLTREELDHPAFASLIESTEKIAKFLWEHSDAYRRAKAELRRRKRRRKRKIWERTLNAL